MIWLIDITQILVAKRCKSTHHLEISSMTIDPINLWDDDDDD